MRDISQTGDTSTTKPWRPWWRWLISGLLAFHVTAVFMGPFAFSTRTPTGTSSDLAEWIMPVFRPYVQAAYLDHGYAFFAPDPGPSHLIKYKVEFEDGRPSIEKTFPNLNEQRPRLLYHRYFMLSEHLHSSYARPTFRLPARPISRSIASLQPEEVDNQRPPPDEPRTMDSLQRAEWNRDRTQREREAESRWERDRQLYDARWNSFERHLLQVHAGDSVSMVRIEHRNPSPFLVTRLGFRLDDENLYQPYTKDQLGDP